MAQSIYCFLYKHEELILDPQDPCKKPCIMGHFCHAGVQRWRSVGRGYSQLRCVGELQVQWQTDSETKVEEGGWKKILNFDLWPLACGQYTIITYAHTCTCAILAEVLMLISQKEVLGEWHGYLEERVGPQSRPDFQDCTLSSSQSSHCTRDLQALNVCTVLQNAKTETEHQCLEWQRSINTDAAFFPQKTLACLKI